MNSTFDVLSLIPYWAEIKCMVHVALPKQTINQFQPVQQSGKQALRAYCPDIYSGTTCDNDLLSAYRAMGLGQGAKNKIVYFIQGNKS